MRSPQEDRYAVVVYQDKELRLDPGGSLSIGRHRGNDLVLESASVSRFHAHIRWPESEPRPGIVDLGSQNGTTIAGRAVGQRSVPLLGGETILVGTRLVRFHVRTLASAALLAEAPEVVALFSEHGPPLHGRVDSSDELASVALAIEEQERTGTLHLEGEGGEEAQITFCKGMVMAARKGEALRTRALELILKAKGPQAYRFGADLEPTSSAMRLRFSDYVRRWRGGDHSPRPFRTHRRRRSAG